MRTGFRGALAVVGVSVALIAPGATGAGAVGLPGTAGRTTAAQVRGSVAGFAVESANFWSAARGVALGGVACTLGEPCAARLILTTDGGTRWRYLHAPGVDVASGRHALSVSRVLFAGPRRGWLYGPALWTTADGGARWSKLDLGGAVDAMAAGARRVYAVVSPPHGKARELFTSPAGQSSWKRIPQVSGSVLAVHGRSAWLGSDSSLWATASGTRWHRYPFRCPAAARGVGLASIAAASSGQVLLLCLGSPAGPQQVKDLMGTSNGGRTTRLLRSLQLGGDGGLIAEPPGRPKVITLGTEYFLDNSSNGGKTWTMKFVAAGGGAPWSIIAYLSPTAGWAEVGQPPTFDALFRTTNAGRTWHRIRF